MFLWGLSKRARQLLAAKVAEYGLPRRAILEAMVTEFATSPPETKRTWELARRRKACAYLERQPIALGPDEVAQAIVAAYEAGHREGWVDFQLRHPDTFINRINALARDRDA